MNKDDIIKVRVYLFTVTLGETMHEQKKFSCQPLKVFGFRFGRI